MLVVNPFSALGDKEGEIPELRENDRRFLATVFSTPRYWPILEMFGWPELGPHLKQLVRAERWEDMIPRCTDEMLDTLRHTTMRPQMSWSNGMAGWSMGRRSRCHGIPLMIRSLRPSSRSSDTDSRRTGRRPMAVSRVSQTAGFITDEGLGSSGTRRPHESPRTSGGAS